MENEIYRKIIHISFGFFALLLRYITPLQTVFLTMAAFLFNFFLLHKVTSRRVFREDEDQRGYSIGILLYPISILLLTIVFHRRMEIVAAAWGFMAFGDGFATIAGKLIKGKKLPWNKKKSFAGLFSFIFFSTIMAAFLFWWVLAGKGGSSVPIIEGILLPIFITSCLCAIIESLPLKIDDNFSVPMLAGASLYFFF